MKIQFRKSATEPGDQYPTRFAPNAWDGQIGKVIPFRIGADTAPARLVAAEVIENGAAVLLTIETVDDALDDVLLDNASSPEASSDQRGRL
jgi:hypothetical protein